MPTSRLPLDIKSFLMESIDSVTHLEVLLKLYQNPEKKWDVESVRKEMRSSLSSASQQLASLTEKGLLICNANYYSYKPSTPELDNKVRKLHQLYHDMPVAVVTCIYERPAEKLKNFSDAFKIKKD